MKLNHDCIRDLLIYLEDTLPIDGFLRVNQLTLGIYSKDDLIYTAQKLEEAGYIKCKNSRYVGDDLPCVDIYSITYQGHQFLDNIRDEKVFAKTKSMLSMLKSVSIEIVSETASKVITNMINQQLNS